MLQVLRKLGLSISDTMIEKIASAADDAILNLLTQISLKVGEAEGDHLDSTLLSGCTDSSKAFHSITSN
jgi:hypothetical protein